MSPISIALVVSSIIALYFGKFLWFVAALFIFYVGAKTFTSFDDSKTKPAESDATPADEPSSSSRSIESEQQTEKARDH